jgi:hypothetical protein
MDITIFSLLIAISLFFIFFGYYSRSDSEIFSVAGFTILFIAGLIILPATPSGVDYITGKTIQTDSNNITTENILYTTYNNFTIGFVITILSFLGFVNIYFRRKPKDDE